MSGESGAKENHPPLFSPLPPVSNCKPITEVEQETTEATEAGNEERQIQIRRPVRVATAEYAKAGRESLSRHMFVATNMLVLILCQRVGISLFEQIAHR